MDGRILIEENVLNIDGDPSQENCGFLLRSRCGRRRGVSSREQLVVRKSPRQRLLRGDRNSVDDMINYANVSRLPRAGTTLFQFLIVCQMIICFSLLKMWDYNGLIFQSPNYHNH